MFGNNWIFPFFLPTVCCLSSPLNPGLQHREKYGKGMGDARCFLSSPELHPELEQHLGCKQEEGKREV